MALTRVVRSSDRRGRDALAEVCTPPHCRPMRAAAFLLPFSLSLAPGTVAHAQRTPTGPRTSASAQYRDTLTSLSAGGSTTCLTTTAGSAFCWGALGARDGTPVQILSADGRPARLRSMATSDFTRCGLTPDGEV